MFETWNGFHFESFVARSSGPGGFIPEPVAIPPDGDGQRPAAFRIPAALLHRLAGDFADELLLGGQRVIPNKALSSGFVFRHETLRSAFEAIF